MGLLKSLARPLAVLMTLTTWVAACSPGAMPVSQSAGDPSNPNAAEGDTRSAADAGSPRDGGR